jgi:ArsR family transcriptional regulator
MTIAVAAPIADAVCCTPGGSAPISADAADALAASIKALADPTRLRLLSIVATSPEGEACVCDLTEPVGLSQPTVSHHLRILTEAGYLTRSKRGTWAYYRVVPGALERVAASIVASPVDGG